MSEQDRIDYLKKELDESILEKFALEADKAAITRQFELSVWVNIAFAAVFVTMVMG